MPRIQVITWESKCDHCEKEIEQEENAVRVFTDIGDYRLAFETPTGLIWIDEDMIWCDTTCFVDWFVAHALELARKEFENAELKPQTIPCCDCGEPVLVTEFWDGESLRCEDCIQAELDTW